MSKIEIKNSKNIGKLFRELRKKQKLTQEQIAGLSNLGNRFIVELEAGKPTLQIDKTLHALRTLGLKVYLENALLEEEINE